MTKIIKFQNASQKLGRKDTAKGKDVALLQALLNRFGYLQGGCYTPGEFCKNTESAVKRFQRFHNIKCTGEADKNTKKVLMEPRCGLPDEIGESGTFVLRGCQYDGNNLTYAFENSSADLPDEQARNLVRVAFEEWSSVSPLRFTEVLPAQNPTFTIGWHSGVHGDSDAFDGPGNVIAHAFFPPPCGGVHAGKMHFDEDEIFTASAASGLNLQAVALHEIGHLLGLGHSDDTNAIMFPTYSSSRLNLAEDDIAGIQAIYGAPQMRFTAEAAGNLPSTGAEETFAIALPGVATISLDGPNNADFDLYIKREEPPTTSDFDFRAWTVSADESLAVSPQTPGLYYIMVHSYSGSGDFVIKVNLESGAIA